MRLSRFFELVVRYGIKADPRKNKKLISGYSDSAILNGPLSSDIGTIFAGIDIDTSELLLADHLRKNRAPVDLVLSHHPQGQALAGLFGVIEMQQDILRSAGVDGSAAKGYLEERKRQVQRRLSSGNHMRSVDAARLLKLPFVCAHTPADNHAFMFIQGLFARRRPGTLEDILKILLEIPEYLQADKRHAGPHILLGNPKRPCGKILVEMTGGTEGHQDIYPGLYKAGVRTLVSMHLSEEHFRRVSDANLNVVIAGHISSDTLGLNLLLDNIERHGDFEVLEASGFRRVKRD